MMANELGDPCIPHADTQFGGDLKTRAMSALYQWAFDIGPNEPWTKHGLFDMITKNQEEDERLDYFGDLNSDLRKKREPNQARNRT